MQIASDFFLVKFENIICKFGIYGSLSNVTFENYARLFYWRRPTEFLFTLIVFERLEKIE